MSSAASKLEIIVIGCGVSGLTSGLRLLEEGLRLEKGFRVKILTEETPDKETSRITSRAAAAVWYPYSVNPSENVVRWAGITYRELENIASGGCDSVSFVPFVQVYTTRAEFEKKVRALWWVPFFKRFEHPAKELPQEYEYGYEAEVPLMDTSRYLKYLMDRFTDQGGQIEYRKINDLNDMVALTEKHPLVINCTGVWARDLCESGAGQKKFTAKRGQVVCIRKRSDIKRCLVHIGEDKRGEVLTYIIPRRDDCLLGGTSEPGNWNLKPNGEVEKSILERCKALEPSLRNLKEADIIGSKVGLRPARERVRLEAEVIGRGRVIHNYGHGGDGFTLSWGCAEDVAQLACQWL